MFLIITMTCAVKYVFRVMCALWNNLTVVLNLATNGMSLLGWFSWISLQSSTCFHNLLNIRCNLIYLIIYWDAKEYLFSGPEASLPSQIHRDEKSLHATQQENSHLLPPTKSMFSSYLGSGEEENSWESQALSLCPLLLCPFSSNTNNTWT